MSYPATAIGNKPTGVNTEKRPPTLSGIRLLRLGEPARHELRIGDRALTHFRIVIAVRLELGFDMIFIGDLVKLTEEVARCELCESVRNRSLFGVSAG